MPFYMILESFFNVTISPKSGWLKQSQSIVNPYDIIKSLLIPVLLLTSIISFIGVLRISDDSTLTATKYFVFNLLTGFLGILGSSWAINKLSGALKGVRDFPKSLMLVSYSASIFLILSTLAKVIPSLGLIFGIISLWSIYVFILGIDPLLQIPRERIAGFSLISLIVFSLVFFLLYVILGLILKLPINL